MSPAVLAYSQGGNYKDMIMQRGKFLMRKDYRYLMDEMLNNLYIHSSSKEEIKQGVAQVGEAEF
jgi:hypothetical protein